MTASENLRQSARFSHQGGDEADNRVGQVQRLDATAEIMINAINALFDRSKGGGAEVSISGNAAQAAERARSGRDDLRAAAAGAENILPGIASELTGLAARSDALATRNQDARAAVSRAEEALLAARGLLVAIRTEHLRDAGGAYAQASVILHECGDAANGIVDGGRALLHQRRRLVVLSRSCDVGAVGAAWTLS